MKRSALVGLVVLALFAQSVSRADDVSRELLRAARDARLGKVEKVVVLRAKEAVFEGKSFSHVIQVTVAVPSESTEPASLVELGNRFVTLTTKQLRVRNGLIVLQTAKGKVVSTFPFSTIGR